jgi:hypothetical protein
MCAACCGRLSAAMTCIREPPPVRRIGSSSLPAGYRRSALVADAWCYLVTWPRRPRCAEWTADVEPAPPIRCLNQLSMGDVEGFRGDRRSWWTSPRCRSAGRPRRRSSCHTATTRRSSIPSARGRGSCRASSGTGYAGRQRAGRGADRPASPSACAATAGPVAFLLVTALMIGLPRIGEYPRQMLDYLTLLLCTLCEIPPSRREKGDVSRQPLSRLWPVR